MRASPARFQPPRVTEGQVLKLLEARHSSDVFIAECKNGPTQTAGARMVRMDAWTMPRSWAYPECTAYEVKVSRGDFLRDEKWHKYLPLCHRLYFVAPAEVVSREEIPDQCGLLEVSKNGKRLTRRKLAPTREVTIPEALFRYVLMARTRTVKETQRDRRSHHIAAWKEFLREKDEAAAVGYLVRQKIRRLADHRATVTSATNERLQSRIVELEHIENILTTAGLDDIKGWSERRKAEAALVGSMTQTLTGALLETIAQAMAVLEHLEPEGPSGE